MANVTLVVAVQRVLLGMGFQPVGLRETGTTKLAHKGPFSRVKSHMLSQMVLHLESLATMLADMRALIAVCASVSVDRAEVRESSVTALEVTLEWPVTSMVAFV